jgi:predicted dehydrogenase
MEIAMTASEKVRFAVIGANHNHIYSQVQTLQEAGAELASFYIAEKDLAESFHYSFPESVQVRSIAAILEDKQIRLIACAAIPNERASLGIEALRHGKDFMSDKPGFTTLEQIKLAREVQAQTGGIYSIFFSERLGNPATVKAGELVRAGAIGKVVHTASFGPHRLNLSSRPDWFFKKKQYGGILVDIASHQVDQFLFFSGSSSAKVLSSSIANYKYPQYPEFEDFGEMTLLGDDVIGNIRVDWFTPDALPSWGDCRLLVLGTEGYIEVRKNIDVAGRDGGNHLILVNHDEIQYIDCSAVKCPYGEDLLNDVRERTSLAMPQDHVFLVSELAILAENGALRLGHRI